MKFQISSDQLYSIVEFNSANILVDFTVCKVSSSLNFVKHGDPDKTVRSPTTDGMAVHHSTPLAHHMIAESEIKNQSLYYVPVVPNLDDIDLILISSIQSLFSLPFLGQFYATDGSSAWQEAASGGHGVSGIPEHISICCTTPVLEYGKHLIESHILHNNAAEIFASRLPNDLIQSLISTFSLPHRLISDENRTAMAFSDILPRLAPLYSSSLLSYIYPRIRQVNLNEHVPCVGQHGSRFRIRAIPNGVAIGHCNWEVFFIPPPMGTGSIGQAGTPHQQLSPSISTSLPDLLIVTTPPVSLVRHTIPPPMKLQGSKVFFSHSVRTNQEGYLRLLALQTAYAYDIQPTQQIDGPQMSIIERALQNTVHHDDDRHRLFPFERMLSLQSTAASAAAVGMGKKNLITKRVYLINKILHEMSIVTNCVVNMGPFNYIYDITNQLIERLIMNDTLSDVNIIILSKTGHKTLPMTQMLPEDISRELHDKMKDLEITLERPGENLFPDMNTYQHSLDNQTPLWDGGESSNLNRKFFNLRAVFYFEEYLVRQRNILAHLSDHTHPDDYQLWLNSKKSQLPHAGAQGGGRSGQRSSGRLLFFADICDGLRDLMLRERNIILSESEFIQQVLAHTSGLTTSNTLSCLLQCLSSVVKHNADPASLPSVLTDLIKPIHELPTTHHPSPQSPLAPAIHFQQKTVNLSQADLLKRTQRYLQGGYTSSQWPLESIYSEQSHLDLSVVGPTTTIPSSPQHRSHSHSHSHSHCVLPITTVHTFDNTPCILSSIPDPNDKLFSTQDIRLVTAGNGILDAVPRAEVVFMSSTDGPTKQPLELLIQLTSIAHQPNDHGDVASVVPVLPPPFILPPLPKQIPTGERTPLEAEAPETQLRFMNASNITPAIRQLFISILTLPDAAKQFTRFHQQIDPNQPPTDTLSTLHLQQLYVIFLFFLSAVVYHTSHNFDLAAEDYIPNPAQVVEQESSQDSSTSHDDEIDAHNQLVYTNLVALTTGTMKFLASIRHSTLVVTSSQAQFIFTMCLYYQFLLAQQRQRRSSGGEKNNILEDLSSTMIPTQLQCRKMLELDRRIGRMLAAFATTMPFLRLVLPSPAKPIPCDDAKTLLQYLWMQDRDAHRLSDPNHQHIDDRGQIDEQLQRKAVEVLSIQQLIGLSSHVAVVYPGLTHDVQWNLPQASDEVCAVDTPPVPIPAVISAVSSPLGLVRSTTTTTTAATEGDDHLRFDFTHFQSFLDQINPKDEALTVRCQHDDLLRPSPSPPQPYSDQSDSMYPTETEVPIHLLLPPPSNTLNTLTEPSQWFFPQHVLSQDGSPSPLPHQTTPDDHKSMDSSPVVRVKQTMVNATLIDRRVLAWHPPAHIDSHPQSDVDISIHPSHGSYKEMNGLYTHSIDMCPPTQSPAVLPIHGDDGERLDLSSSSHLVETTACRANLHNNTSPIAGHFDLHELLTQLIQTFGTEVTIIHDNMTYSAKTLRDHPTQSVPLIHNDKYIIKIPSLRGVIQLINNTVQPTININASTRQSRRTLSELITRLPSTVALGRPVHRLEPLVKVNCEGTPIHDNCDDDHIGCIDL